MAQTRPGTIGENSRYTDIYSKRGAPAYGGVDKGDLDVVSTDDSLGAPSRPAPQNTKAVEHIGKSSIVSLTVGSEEADNTNKGSNRPAFTKMSDQQLEKFGATVQKGGLFSSRNTKGAGRGAVQDYSITDFSELEQIDNRARENSHTLEEPEEVARPKPGKGILSQAGIKKANAEKSFSLKKEPSKPDFDKSNLSISPEEMDRILEEEESIQQGDMYGNDASEYGNMDPAEYREDAIFGVDRGKEKKSSKFGKKKAKVEEYDEDEEFEAPPKKKPAKAPKEKKVKEPKAPKEKKVKKPKAPKEKKVKEPKSGGLFGKSKGRPKTMTEEDIIKNNNSSRKSATLDKGIEKREQNVQLYKYNVAIPIVTILVILAMTATSVIMIGKFSKESEETEKNLNQMQQQIAAMQAQMNSSVDGEYSEELEESEEVTNEELESVEQDSAPVASTNDISFADLSLYLEDVTVAAMVTDESIKEVDMNGFTVYGTMDTTFTEQQDAFSYTVTSSDGASMLIKAIETDDIDFAAMDYLNNNVLPGVSNYMQSENESSSDRSMCKSTFYENDIQYRHTVVVLRVYEEGCLLIEAKVPDGADIVTSSTMDKLLTYNIADRFEEVA